MLPSFRALGLVVVLSQAACSFGLNTATTDVRSSRSPVCSTSRAAPVLDLIGSGALLLLASSLDDGRSAAAIGSASFGAVGLYGLVKSSRCRTERIEWQENQRLAMALQTAAGSPQPAMAHSQLPPAPAPENHAAPVAGPPAAQVSKPATPSTKPCGAGGVCPKGSVCDPLLHQCVQSNTEGLQGSRCADSASCDDGLYCDRDVGRCRAGRVGRDGGQCHPDGACDGGFVCATGLCVRQAEKRPSAR